MKKPQLSRTSRREFLAGVGALAGVSMMTLAGCAKSDKIRVGFMLPYTGTYARLGVAIENGFRLALADQGGKLGGREVEYFKVDDESNPAKATENANKIIARDKVEVRA